MKPQLRTTEDKCPHCGSKNVVSVGGGAQAEHNPDEMLYKCCEAKCGEVYVRVGSKRESKEDFDDAE